MHEKVAKCMLLFTGLCYMVSAGILMYIGAWVFNTYDDFDEIADSTITLFPASIILGVGSFMCIVGVLACIAAFKNNKCLLSVFFCLVLLIFIGEVLGAALGYFYRGKVEGILRDDLTEAINDYNVTVNQKQIDYMQKTFHCCGVHNASDWQHSTFWQQNHTVPQSCCIHRPCNATIGDNEIYTKGCLDSLEDKFSDNLVYIAVSVVIMACLQFLALICTCVLVCRTKEQIPYMAFGEQVGGGLRV